MLGLGGGRGVAGLGAIDRPDRRLSMTERAASIDATQYACVSRSARWSRAMSNSKRNLLSSGRSDLEHIESASMWRIMAVFSRRRRTPVCLFVKHEVAEDPL